jgi:hypothetical protein
MITELSTPVSLWKGTEVAQAREFREGSAGNLQVKDEGSWLGFTDV